MHSNGAPLVNVDENFIIHPSLPTLLLKKIYHCDNDRFDRQENFRHFPSFVKERDRVAQNRNFKKSFKIFNRSVERHRIVDLYTLKRCESVIVRNYLNISNDIWEKNKCAISGLAFQLIYQFQYV